MVAFASLLCKLFRVGQGESENIILSNVSPEDMENLLGIRVKGEGSGSSENLASLFRYLNERFAAIPDVESPESKLIPNPGGIRVYEPEGLVGKDIPSLLVLDQARNTQDVLKTITRLLEGNPGLLKIPEFSAVMAVNQTMGRGFSGRKWSSVKGNLHASVFGDGLFPMSNDSPNIRAMAQSIISTVLMDSLKKFLVKTDESGADMIFGKRDGLIIVPWNNVFLDIRKKLAGILIESDFMGSKELETIGIGVNFNDVSADGDFKKSNVTQYTASIREILEKFEIQGNGISPYALLNEFCGDLKDFSESLRGCSGDTTQLIGLLKGVFDKYTSYFRQALKGKKIRVYDSDHLTLCEDGEGEFVDFERVPDPAVIIRNKYKEIKKFPIFGGIQVL